MSYQARIGKSPAAFGPHQVHYDAVKAELEDREITDLFWIHPGKSARSDLLS
jgi:hypothetical protein